MLRCMETERPSPSSRTFLFLFAFRLLVCPCHHDHNRSLIASHASHQTRAGEHRSFYTKVDKQSTREQRLGEMGDISEERCGGVPKEAERNRWEALS